MSGIKTQKECRDDYLDAVEEFVRTLDGIDGETPATPIEEPEWWAEMMDLRRHVAAIHEEHKRAAIKAARAERSVS